MKLSEREQAVLEALVELFVRDAGPVSSGHLQSELPLSVSSATIRNVLHRLEKKGLLHQPHTSAGRVPTPLGYRLYVETYLRPARLPGRLVRRIHQELTQDQTQQGVQNILQRVSHLLAALSNNVGFGVAIEDHQAARIERIEMVQLEHGKLLVVVTLDDGMVRTCMLPREERVARHALELAEQMLNRIVAGCTPAQARQRLDEALDYGADEASAIARSIVQDKERIFQDGARRQVHLEGATEIMGQPEFQDPEYLRQLVRLLDHPEDLGNLVADHGAEPSPIITIGVESAQQELPFSLVTATCNLAGWEGHIGILGPMRMRYALALALVNNVAETLASLDEARVQEDEESA